MIISVSSFGQQDPMFTQYMNNPQLINPAYAGSQGSLNFNGIFRNQWSNWQGNGETPTTTSLSVNGPFRVYQVGLGLDFTHDQQGPFTQSSLFANYAYHLNLNNGQSTLSLGLKTGFYFFQEDYSNSNPAMEYDPLLINGTQAMFNTGIGAYYFTENLFIGASVPKLIRNDWTEEINTYEIVGRQEQHYYLTAGYVFDINADFSFKPTGMLRLVQGAPLSAEITGTAIFSDRIWFGLMYRLKDAWAVHARFEVRDGFQIGYSYDMTTSPLMHYNSGTHEIFFSYTIKKKAKKIVSPRFF